MAGQGARTATAKIVVNIMQYDRALSQRTPEPYNGTLGIYVGNQNCHYFGSAHNKIEDTCRLNKAGPGHRMNIGLSNVCTGKFSAIEAAMTPGRYCM